MQSNMINKNGQQCDTGLISGMLRHSKAIVPLLVLIFSLLFYSNVSAQCGPGKISETIQGFGSIVTADYAYNNNTGINALGGPDGVGAFFSNNGQYIIIDLLDTVKAGQTYSFIWRQYPGVVPASQIWWSESVNGIAFTDHPSSGLISTTNERYFITDVIAASDTRYIRISMVSGTNDFNFDAISYYATKCYSDNCGAGYSTQLVSGNGVYSSGIGIGDPNNVNYVPDGSGALLNSAGDWIRIRLPYTISAGQEYYIIWRPVDNNAQMKIRESLDGSTWSGWKNSSLLASSAYFVLHIEKAGTPTRYIEIAAVSPINPPDFYVDAVVFNAITCVLPAPDLDVSGDFEYCGSPISIATALAITDPNNQTINAAYVQIGTGFVPGQDVLSCTNAFGITSSYNSTYGVLYLSGTATISQYQSVLRSVIYSNNNGTSSR